MYFIRLVMRTGPCLGDLTARTGKRVMRKINLLAGTDLLPRLGWNIFSELQARDFAEILTLGESETLLETLYQICDTSDPQVGEKAVQLYNELDYYLNAIQ